MAEPCSRYSRPSTNTAQVSATIRPASTPSCPTYLPTPPRTASGAEFLYNNQNGALSVPGASPAGAPAAPASGGAPVGGAGPLGETMTGIGISNQLDNMNTGGTSAVSGRMRGVARGAGASTNDRTEAAMDGLGL
jgi:hypothetical protein